ncbi:MAG: hypothetical protein IJK23_01760 [Clostridia bacterium]|nr:hypothetical protein [Clostridia bacterium]
MQGFSSRINVRKKDEKTTTISDQDMERVATAFERMIRNHTLEDKLSLLPPGAERDAYMRITFCSHNESFYSNVYVEENGIKVIREPVAEEFTQIVNVLKQRCALL